LFGGVVLTLLPTSASEMWVITPDEIQDVSWRTAE
jgi:hypothetical protein